MIVKEKRIEKGLSQAALAREVRIAQSMICSIEKGTRQPSVTVAKRIGVVLGFDWTLLYEADGYDVHQETSHEAAHIE